METILKQELKIDKTNWELVKFGDVAFEPKETMKDIVSDGIEHVVGLEHITSGDIHLRNSASIDESTTFTKKFAKGDVLFGRRRAYLKKAAVAHFDGICSGDITVFRAKSNLLPELLPFIVNNDKFFDYAIQHSAGGLSPRVKFKDLANYEFQLPPKDQQAQLAELLWTMDEVIEKEKDIFKKIEIVENSFRNSEIDFLKAEEFKLDNLLVPSSQVKIGKIEKTLYNDSGKYPIIDQSMEFIIGYSDDENLVYKGDLPVIVFGDHTTILKFIDFPFIMGADGTKIIKAISKVDTKYLFHALKKINIQPQGYRRHFSILKNEKIKIPDSKKWIKMFTTKMDIIELQKNNVSTKIKSSQSLQKSLINQVF